MRNQEGILNMWNVQQMNAIDTIRELTLGELNAVSGGDGPDPICTGQDDPVCNPPRDCPWWNPFC
jgi:hypothetical protein